MSSTALPTQHTFLTTGVLTVSASESAGTCPICHRPFTEAVQIACSKQHVFCKSCIFIWLTVNNTCPADREVLYTRSNSLARGRRTAVLYRLDLTLVSGDRNGADVGGELVFLLNACLVAMFADEVVGLDSGGGVRVDGEPGGGGQEGRHNSGERSRRE
ncbi:hypothetical protein CERZMDRAFT_100083 [Cercospora zeae-maydis SCOH1-5]|uniref:RING-type domain-containing protein n=1 Tax=Cercospora zeae-maydis SCOH1-5 TaxID=717836 RepID=A0A6A6F7U0_9PEZI|nr:hypothetical protein CERZMDRAFT_100083 [Cercospora zeae-maydis SCOH1-5]